MKWLRRVDVTCLHSAVTAGQDRQTHRHIGEPAVAHHQKGDCLSRRQPNGYLEPDFAAATENHHDAWSSRGGLIPKLAGVSHRVGHVSDYVLR